jgi:hypothetical protein
MKKIKFYLKLLLTDRKAFRHQLWMVYNRHKVNSIKWLFRRFSAARKEFITTHARPILAADIGTWTDRLINNPRSAIVMQGPLVSDYDFTLETVRLYKKHFVDTDIIVSTWEDADKEYLAKIEKAGAVIILNKKPAVAGIGNINMQLVTTMGGLRKAKELGVEYAYKTRSDQRMYAVNINEYLVNLVNHFPVKAGFKQHKRLIASGFGSLKYSPYLLTDVWVFGQIDDMLTYWGLDLEDRPPLAKPVTSIKDLVDAKINESYICAEFLKKIGRTPDWTIHNWWQALADHFIIVDTHSLDLFFYKYDFYQEHRQLTYAGNNNNQPLTFKDWLNIYANLKNKKPVSEEALNLPRRDSIIPENYGD